MQKITPFLWFDHSAEEAMHFYTGIFKDSSIDHTEYYPDESLDEHFKGMSGKLITGVFTLMGRQFMCLDGGPIFTPNPSVSFFCTFVDDDDLQTAWDKLSDGGKALMELSEYPWAKKYGWVQDKYGFSWQMSLADELQGQPIVPMLTFTQDKAGRAKEAMEYYASVFKDSGIDFVAEYQDGEQDTPGFVKYAAFHLGGDQFGAMDSSGPHEFVFNEAISLLVECQDQAEIDNLWDKLSTVPQSEQCGWCKDQFGVSWQIVPKNMKDLIQSPGAIQTMMQMKKIDIATLQAASEQ